MITKILLYVSFLIFSFSDGQCAKVQVGAEVFFQGSYDKLLSGKKIGLITNHTAVNNKMENTLELFKKHATAKKYTLTSLFAPEHGIYGVSRASEHVEDSFSHDGIPVYSLHGKTRRPTEAMLKDINLLIYDIQDIGSRSYTYISTLFYAMEEAAKLKIPFIVLDRPNPINGLIVDGPIVKPEWRSFVGYLNIPYCHGMTVGELARFFNEEYQIGCQLTVVPMEGWSRAMTFSETGLPWIPTSPQIPEASTVLYYPTTGILGELKVVSIGIGYTLPFKLVGAPWIDADHFANKLNEQNFPGVRFQPFYFKPFFGRFANEVCNGILINVTNPKKYLPVCTSYLIMGMLKSLYPKQFEEGLQTSEANKDMICKIHGTDEVFNILKNEKYVIWKLRQLHAKEIEDFKSLRNKHLIPKYR